MNAAPLLQVDACGWGCLVGSAVVGVFDPAGMRFTFRSLPQECFQEGFAEKAYLAAAVRAVQECLIELQQWPLPPASIVEVCSEFLLTEVCVWLRSLPQLEVRSARFTSTSSVRILAATAFVQILHSLRFDITADLLDNEPRIVFRRAILWLRGGDTRRVNWKLYRSRVRHVKTGWSSFQRIRAQMVHGPDRFVP